MRVAISVINGEGYGRQVARGVVDYARPRPDWQFFGEHFGFLEPVMDMQKWRGDGAIILCGAGRARPLARRRIPIVNVSTSSEPIYLPAVIPDNLQVGRVAAKAFLEDGFRRLAYVKYFDFFFSRQRGEGFAAAAADAGVEVLRQDCKPRGRDWWDGSSSELRALGGWLSRQEYPLGVFTASDQRGSQVIKAAQLAGLRVPEQVAVIGVDNDDIGCDITRPRLSSVDVNAREIGYRAAELLDAMMHGAPAPKEPTLVPPLGLVRRASSDILAVEDAELAAAMKFIRDHVAQTTTVDDVLDSVGISRSSLERKFHKHLGRTPLEEIRRVHVEAARDLLVHTRWSIPQVAQRCGFATPERFATVFRKETGETPTGYRKRMVLSEG